MMAFVEEELVQLHGRFSQKLLNNEWSIFLVYAYFALFSITCAGFASYLTVAWGPGANGSGVAEIMGILNGVNYKGAIGIATLLVKILGVILAVVGNLCVGKEGPLAHIGAIIGVTICYLPFEKFKIF